MITAILILCAFNTVAMVMFIAIAIVRNANDDDE